MSEMTRCNHCSLEDIRRDNPTVPVTLVRDPEMDGWFRVWVNGEPTGRWFMAITDRCVC